MVGAEGPCVCVCVFRITVLRACVCECSGRAEKVIYNMNV